MNNRTEIIKGSINKMILKLSAPMIIAFLLQTSFNIVDGIFVGRLSAEALAAVSISFPVIILMIALASGLGIGTTSVIARSIGAKNYKKANNTAEHSILLAILFSMIFTFSGLLFGKQLFSLITKDSNLITLVLQYSNIIFAGSIMMFLAFIGNNILRGEGDMKVPMYVMGGSAILNIILDPIFIFTLGFGIRGAAIATVIARTAGFIGVFAYLLKGRSVIKLNLKYFRLNFRLIKEIIYMGMPSSVSQIIGSLSLFLLTGIIAAFGAEAIAAFGIIFRVEGFAVMPIMGMMTALITIIGQNIGAKKIKRARKITFNASAIAGTFGLVMGILFFVFSGPLAALFNSNVNVISYVSSFFMINIVTYLMFGIIIGIVASFLGAGKPIPPLTINTLRSIVIMVPLAYILSASYGLTGVWIAILISSTVASILGIIWFRIIDFKA